MKAAHYWLFCEIIHRPICEGIRRPIIWDMLSAFVFCVLIIGSHHTWSMSVLPKGNILCLNEKIRSTSLHIWCDEKEKQHVPYWDNACPCVTSWLNHDDVIKWRHFPRYWPFVRGIHRSPVNSPHKGQWRGALMFSLICVWINGWVNIGEAGDLTYL